MSKFFKAVGILALIYASVLCVNLVNAKRAKTHIVFIAEVVCRQDYQGVFFVFEDGHYLPIGPKEVSEAQADKWMAQYPVERKAYFHICSDSVGHETAPGTTQL